MKQEAFSYFTETHLTVVALMIFFGYFAVMLIKTFASSNKRINQLENLPLEDQNEVLYESR